MNNESERAKYTIPRQNRIDGLELAENVYRNLEHQLQSLGPAEMFTVELQADGTVLLCGAEDRMLKELLHAIAVEVGDCSTLLPGCLSLEQLHPAPVDNKWGIDAAYFDDTPVLLTVRFVAVPFPGVSTRHSV